MTSVWCATSEDLADQSGGYYSRQKAKDLSPVGLDDTVAKHLWEASERWCGVAPQHL